jgi:pimeloyl-ACP methyl ester carboxylesterase
MNRPEEVLANEAPTTHTLMPPARAVARRDARSIDNPADVRLASLERPGWLPEAVWPFRTWALEVEGSRVAVTDVGQGPTLLFAHTGFWSFIWRDVILRLAPHFRCVCFDAPGTGQSDRLPSRSVSLEGASRALSAIVRALDLQDVTLVFHDLGGPSGIAGAARVSTRIRGLCAVNAFAWRPTGAAFRGALSIMGSATVRELDAWTGALVRITASSFGVGLRMDAASRKAFRAGVGRQGARAFHSYLRDARRAEAIYRELQEAFSGSLGRLPLLTIFGERNDPLGFQPRWRQLFGDIRQVVVSKGNHFPMCDDPDLVAASIRDWHRERVGPLCAASRNESGLLPGEAHRDSPPAAHEGSRS